MKAVFIVNPAAGHGRGGGFWRRVGPLIQESFGPHDLKWTRAPGHAAELARAAAEAGAERIIAVGGDGTLSQVVDGFLSVPESRRPHGAVGCLPAGSGCDFARHFGVPRDPKQWVPRLAAAQPRRIDAALARYVGLDGRERSSHWVNIVAFGIAGEIALDTEKSGKPFGGTLSYLVSSVSAIARAKPKAMRLVVDGQGRIGEFHLVALANTSTTGGGMKIAPQADASDGALDLVTVGPLGRMALLRSFPRIYAGTHLAVEGVASARVRTLEARSDEPVYLNLDGEAAGRLPASFEVLPGVLPALLP